MNIEKLIKMANQIGTFFESMPDRDHALQGVAQHVKRFWEPRMRHALLTHIENQPDPTLKPIVYEALTTYKQELH